MILLSSDCSNWANISEGEVDICILATSDAVRVPFGTCFKPSKIGCKNQTQMCLGCTSFCSTQEDLPAYDAEIKRVKALMIIGEAMDRSDWVDKNRVYLENLESMKTRILQERIIHKNGNLREDTNG